MRRKAKEIGSGGALLLDRYFQSEKSCYFIIRDKKMINEIGYISTVHNSEDDFGVKTGISNKTGSEQNEHMLFWETAALTALDKNISLDQAESVIPKALANGTADHGLYGIEVKNDPLELSRIISIFRHIGDETVR